MYTVDFFTHNIPIWKQVLTPHKDTPLEFIEIGSFEGRSTVWLLENVLLHPQSHITCVDDFASEEELKEFDFSKIKANFLTNTAPFVDKVTLIQEKSAEYLKRRTELADMIYIDGSHLASDVFIDATLSHLLLKPEGLLIFDDYLWAGLLKTPSVPRGAIDAFMDCFSQGYKLISSGYQVVLQKKA